MISIQNVSKWFGKFKAVDNINIEVEKGEIFGLLGLNGAGKTTTQRMVSTVFQPSEGNITVNGFNSKSDSSEVRRNIGFLPTEVGLYDRLTDREVIKYFAFALIIGVLVGSYSSIFIASPFMLYLKSKLPVEEEE